MERMFSGHDCLKRSTQEVCVCVCVWVRAWVRAWVGGWVGAWVGGCVGGWVGVWVWVCGVWVCGCVCVYMGSCLNPFWRGFPVKSHGQVR